MAIILKNSDIELRIEKAGECYRGSRFDWNGTVVSFSFRGIELLGEERPRFQRNPVIFGRGLHNEFGIKTCIGYDDCKVGEWFPKIGTGWLKKDEKPYFFYNHYSLEQLQYASLANGNREAVFSCESGSRNGYSYRYTKRITLADSGFTIRYELENTGSKQLATEEYVHNFLCVAGKRIDRGYSVTFPWKLNASRFVENVNPDGIIFVDGNRVDAIGKTGKQFYLGGMSEGIAKKDGLEATWTLEHAGKNVRLSEKGNFDPTGVHLWGWKSVISPEVFHSFRLMPGMQTSWEREYTVSAIQLPASREKISYVFPENQFSRASSPT